MNIFDRARDAWAVFRGRDRPVKDWSSEENWGQGVQVTQFDPYPNGGGWNGGGRGPASASRPDTIHLKPVNSKTIVSSVINRIALDVAMVEFHHAYIDENDNFKEVIPGSIEEALTLEANLDQGTFMYMHDLVTSMMNEPDGIVAEVMVECDRDEKGTITDELPIQLRTAKIVKWMPEEVTVDVLDQRTGQHRQVDVSKREVSILENPFRLVMNDPNGLQSRLVKKMALLDKIDTNLGSDKLNAVIQLPYIVRNDIKRAEARDRLKEMEEQLKTSQLGITYVDGTEKIIQLNRPLGEGLQTQIEWMYELYLSQLCITKEILNGTADAKVMANYLQRCIGVFCTVIAQERTRKFLTFDQRKNRQSIVFVQDPFKLIPVTELADLMDKSIRSAIMAPNEWRSIIGYKPSNDPSSNLLANRNMPMDQTPEGAAGGDVVDDSVPPEMQHSAYPQNRQQRRHPDRSKIPRRSSG